MRRIVHSGLLPVRHVRRPDRRGAAVVEAAVCLPLLLLLFIAAVDFARAYKSAQIVAECARIGAVYAADPDLADRSGFDSYDAIALAGASTLQPPPVITITSGTDSRGDDYAEVTVKYSFQMITNFLGTKPITISRTSRARLRPAALLD